MHTHTPWLLPWPFVLAVLLVADDGDGDAVWFVPDLAVIALALNFEVVTLGVFGGESRMA